MTETEFLKQAEALFSSIESALEDSDIEAERAGNVLTLEADNGQQVVVNFHAPTQQIWLASRLGGLHFERRSDQWLATRTAQNFWDSLSEALTAVSGEQVHLPNG